MSSVLQLRSEPVPKFLKARKAAAVKLLMNLRFMGSPALKTQTASPDIQPSTLFSKDN